MRRNRTTRNEEPHDVGAGDATVPQPPADPGADPVRNALGMALGAYNVAPLSTPVSEVPAARALGHQPPADSQGHVVDLAVFDAPTSIDLVVEGGRYGGQPLVEPAGNHLLRLATADAAEPSFAPFRQKVETSMTANPLYYVDLAPTDVGPTDVGLSDVDGSDDEISLVLARIRETKDAVGQTLDRCALAADQLAASAEIFADAAIDLQRVSLERAALDQNIARAIDEIERLRREVIRDRARAQAEHASLLAEARLASESMHAEAILTSEAMRADAIADVERARERLLRFTSEISNVASEMQGAFAPAVNKTT